MIDERKTKKQLMDEINEARSLNAQLREAEEERNAALEAVGESEQRFRAVAQSAVDAIISTDRWDTIIFWNQGAQKIFGYSEEETLGKSVSMIIPEPYRDAHRIGVANYLKTAKPMLIGKTVELEGLRKGGEIFPIELSLSTWKTRADVFFTGIIRDISDRKAAEKALAQRTEELESLIQMVAHDLKSPIISIGGMARLLKKNLSGTHLDEKRDRLLNQLISATQTVERFLGDLLDNLAVEHLKPECGPVKMDELVSEVARRHEHAIQERGIRLCLDIADPLPAVNGDKRRIAQVLDNLLVNAVRHMGQRPDPVIRIHVERDESGVVTRVSDNGVGIPEELHEKIFDRFFRVHRSDSHGGTGLGLSIAKKIVESHGGKLWVESRQGEGATFAFTLPAQEV
jgi:PAS domain S-box-containing protein